MDKQLSVARFAFHKYVFCCTAYGNISYRLIEFLLYVHIFIELADLYGSSDNTGPWIEGLNTRLIEAKAKVF